MERGLRAAVGGPKPIPNYYEICLIWGIGYGQWIVTRWVRKWLARGHHGSTGLVG